MKHSVHKRSETIIDDQIRKHFLSCVQGTRPVYPLPGFYDPAFAEGRYQALAGYMGGSDQPPTGYGPRGPHLCVYELGGVNGVEPGEPT